MRSNPKLTSWPLLSFGPGPSQECNFPASPTWYFFRLGTSLSRCHFRWSCWRWGRRFASSSPGSSLTCNSLPVHCSLYWALQFDWPSFWAMEMLPTALLSVGTTEQEMTLRSLLCEANLCCSRQPVMLMGGILFNAGPLIIPHWLRAWRMGIGLIWKGLSLLERGVLPPPPTNFSWMSVKAPVERRCFSLTKAPGAKEGDVGIAFVVWIPPLVGFFWTAGSSSFRCSHEFFANSPGCSSSISSTFFPLSVSPPLT